MIECPTCDGMGYFEMPSGEAVECPDCDGSGEVSPEAMRDAAEYRRAEAAWQDDRSGYAG